jgi:hypothetical protein
MMAYYGALENAMKEAREDSFLPTDLTREQMLIAIQDISYTLKSSGIGNGQRIVLAAERHTLRLRLQRADDVTTRLLGK